MRAIKSDGFPAKHALGHPVAMNMSCVTICAFDASNDSNVTVHPDPNRIGIWRMEVHIVTWPIQA